MRALAAHWQTLAMAQTAIAGEIHQTFDVHRHDTPQIALDRMFPIDHLANPQNLVVGQFMDATLLRDTDLATNLVCRGPPNPMDIGEANGDAFLIGDIDASNTCHVGTPSDDNCKAQPTKRID
jgi:hypothetical protein